MNILWLSQIVPYPPTGKGVLQRSYNLIRELARFHHVYLLSFVQRKAILDTLGDVDQGLADAYDHLRTFCAEVKFIPLSVDKWQYGKVWFAAKSLFSPDPYSVNWMKEKNMEENLQQWQERYTFDLVHFDTIGLAPYYPIFGNYMTILDHHNIESHMMLRRASMEGNLLKRAYYWQEGVKLMCYEKRWCPRFDLHITCSAVDSQRLKERVPRVRVVEIPNGVDIEYFTADDSVPEPNSLIFAGNLSWYPNAEAMLYFAEKVWPLLRAAVPNAVMNVVGADPPARLTTLANRDPNFKVHGFVPDVRPFLNRAAVYVCPIMNGGGTKLKVLDALAMAKALVAHPIACEGIDVIDGETVLFAQEAEQYVQNIKALFQDPVYCKRMGTRARALAVDKYSYKSIGEKLSEEFRLLALA